MSIKPLAHEQSNAQTKIAHDKGDGLTSVVFDTGGGTVSTTVQIQSSEINSDLSDFPVYVDLSDMPSGFWSNVASDGSDIRVEDSGGNTVPREVVWIDSNNNEGQLYFKAPSVSSSSDTSFTIEAGSGDSAPAATDPNGRNAVWTNDFHRVYHFADSDLTDDKLLDSTGNANAILVGSMDGQQEKGKGLTGSRLEFDGNDDAMTKIPNNLNWDTDSITVEIVEQLSVDPENKNDIFIATVEIPGSESEQLIYWNNDGNLGNFDGNGQYTAIAAYNVGKNHHAIGVSDSSNFEGWLDGTKEATATINFGSITSMSSWDGGASGSIYGDGYKEEYFIYSSTKSDAWWKARNNNLQNRSNFYNTT